MIIEIVLSIICWLLAAIISLPMLVVILEVLASLCYRKQGVVVDQQGALPRTVVLIPAHNEEGLIRQTLASLFSDMPPTFRVLCVAHNCTDATAEIARKEGAEAIEVSDGGGGGKPDALKAGLRWLDANPPDVVIIVDADCRVEKGALRILAAKAWALKRPAMGAYFFESGDPGRGVPTLSSLAILLKNYVRPLGLHVLGLPCLLTGSGSAYPFEIVRHAPHGEGSIAEDFQLTIDLLEQGYPTVFVPEARVYSQLPGNEGTALRQRRRWEHGHMYLVFRAAPRLLRDGLKMRDKNRIALALEVAVPPLVFLGMRWMLAEGLALVLYTFYGHVGPLFWLTGMATAFVMAVLVSWMRFAGIQQTLAAFAAVPSYLIWKLSLYSDFLERREKRWMKTGRD